MMKRLGILMGIVIFIGGFTNAQSQNDYRNKNYKLNKGSVSKHDMALKPIALNGINYQDDVYDYKKRNSKFRKSTHDNVLMIEKERIINDYRALNHKFSKGQHGKFVNRISRKDLLTDN